MSFNARQNVQRRHGATFNVDKDGNPILPRYRSNGRKADDTVRLPPVLIGQNIATPVVRRVRVEGLTTVASEFDLHKEYKPISKATQDQYAQIREEYHLKRQMEELQDEIRKREDAEAYNLAIDAMRKKHNTDKKGCGQVHFGKKDYSTSDSGLNIDSDDDFADILFTPEPTRKSPRKHTPCPSSDSSIYIDDILYTPIPPQVEGVITDTTRSLQNARSMPALITTQISASSLRLENETTEEYSNVDAFAKSITEAEKQRCMYKAAQMAQEVISTSTSDNDEAYEAASKSHQSELSITIPSSVESETTSLAESTESANAAIKKPSLRKRIWKGMKKLFCCR